MYCSLPLYKIRFDSNMEFWQIKKHFRVLRHKYIFEALTGFGLLPYAATLLPPACIITNEPTMATSVRSSQVTGLGYKNPPS